MDQDEPLICFRCKAPALEDDSVFCTNCSHELYSNYCTNEHCNRNNGEQSPLPEDCCYCDLCGQSTVYFEEEIIDTFEVSPHN